MRLVIPCPHDSLPLDAEIVTLPDHHPLTRWEIIQLLESALSEKGHSADQQIRLAQGVPGMTCPRPLDTAVASALNVIDDVFVSFKRREIALEEALTRIEEAY